MSPETYPYGRRQLIRYDKTAQPSYSWQALQPNDFLDPQFGDEFAHGAAHDAQVSHVRQLFAYWHRYNSSMLVASTLKIRWPQIDWAAPAPDLVVIPNVQTSSQPRQLFDVAAEATAPTFVLEITSPLFANFDRVDKKAIYEAAGVTEYFLLDEEKLIGYCLIDGRYQPIAVDARGRSLSEVNRLWLGWDAATARIAAWEQRNDQPVIVDERFSEATSTVQAEATFRAQSIASQLGFLQTGE